MKVSPVLALLAFASLTMCLAKSPTAIHTEHQPSADYYAVAQPACANTDDAVYENGTMPMVDKYEEMEYFASMPEDALLQIMSANNIDMGFDIPGPAPLIEVFATATASWFPRSNSTFQAKSYIHKTRCSSGQSGTIINASMGGAIFKRCASGRLVMHKKSYFEIPPFLCEKSCDKDSACVAYVVDGAGTRCWILARDETSPEPRASYYRISSGSTDTNATSDVIATEPMSTESKSNDNFYAVPHSAYAWGYKYNPNIQNGTAPGVDSLVVSQLPGIVPEDAQLQMMDANKADWSQQKANDHSSNDLWWFAGSNSTFQAKSFIHKTRCADGVSGTRVRASTGTGVTYKKCPPPLSPQLLIGKSFGLPPSLCLQTCNNDTACVGYVVDGAGTRCWILYAKSDPVGFTTYFRISD